MMVCGWVGRELLWNGKNCTVVAWTQWGASGGGWERRKDNKAERGGRCDSYRVCSMWYTSGWWWTESGREGRQKNVVVSLADDAWSRVGEKSEKGVLILVVVVEDCCALSLSLIWEQYQINPFPTFSPLFLCLIKMTSVGERLSWPPVTVSFFTGPLWARCPGFPPQSPIFYPLSLSPNDQASPIFDAPHHALVINLPHHYPSSS